MKRLYDYLSLMEDGEEATVWDVDYDIEVYFYNHTNDKENDLWDESMMELSKLLTIKKIHNNGIEVDLSSLIESHLKELDKAKLFIYCDIDDIMGDMDNILAGCVSEDWLKRFVDVLKG